jgi:murein DD-endopeptidase MepM/ murein hydrolase activator NlpD
MPALGLARPADASLDLLRPPAALAADPEAMAVALELNKHPNIDLDGDPYRFTRAEWSRALANPYVTTHAKAVLHRMDAYFPDSSGRQPSGIALDPGAYIMGRVQAPPPALPPERALIRAALLGKGLPVFNRPYPPDVPEPAPVRSLNLQFPFPPGVRMICQQGNNTMADPGNGGQASHAPDGLRYSLDFCAPDQSEGWPILSTAEGTAWVYDGARVNHPDNWGFGNFVLVDHGNGFATMFAHLKDITVANGQRVGAKQQVGTLGTTGSAGNAHLHLQVVPIIRRPNPTAEKHHGEPGRPGAMLPPPFDATVAFSMLAAEAGGEVRKLRSAEFKSGEAGALWENARAYEAKG